MSTNYIVFHNNEGPYNYYHLASTTSNPYDDEQVRSYDHMLHRTLSEIFHGCTSRQIRQLIRTCRNQHTNKKSIFNLILKREPRLGKLLLKRSELSLLWIVVLSCYQDSAELLVRSGADVNELYEMANSSSKITKQSTLLHALLQMYPSTWNGQFLELLIDHGADLKARDSKSRTVLHVAVIEGRVKEAEVFLKKGIDVNAVRNGRIAAVHDAVFSGKVGELIPLLMRHGANINAKDSYGLNVLSYLPFAPDGEHADLARFLIEKGVLPLESRDTDILRPPLHVAVARGKNELVNLFLDNGFNVNAQDTKFSEFPLYIAAQECANPEVLLTLLKRGANIDLTNTFGETALHSLTGSDENTLKKMKILLSFGADMFARAFEMTAFEIIRLKSTENPSIVELMLKTLALRKACLQPPFEPKHEKIIEEEYPELWGRYRNCIEEIDRIKSTKFIKTGTFFELLTECQCQIALLIRNREFERKIRLYDFNPFPLFAKDILEAFERAERYYRFTVLEQENLINEAVYNTLPHMVVRMMARYALNCEMCEMKKIAKASWGYPIIGML